MVVRVRWWLINDDILLATHAHSIACCCYGDFGAAAPLEPQCFSVYQYVCRFWDLGIEEVFSGGLFQLSPSLHSPTVSNNAYYSPTLLHSTCANIEITGQGDPSAALAAHVNPPMSYIYSKGTCLPLNPLCACV